MVRTTFKLNLRLNQITQGGLNYCNDNRDDKRVSVQGVESLFGDCRFIPADWGS